jgi:hypothetical protein
MQRLLGSSFMKIWQSLKKDVKKAISYLRNWLYKALINLILSTYVFSFKLQRYIGDFVQVIVSVDLKLFWLTSISKMNHLISN